MCKFYINIWLHYPYTHNKLVQYAVKNDAPQLTATQSLPCPDVDQEASQNKLGNASLIAALSNWSDYLSCTKQFEELIRSTQIHKSTFQSRKFERSI